MMQPASLPIVDGDASRGVNDPQGRRWDAPRVRGWGRSRHGSLLQPVALASQRAAESAALLSDGVCRREGVSSEGRGCDRCLVAVGVMIIKRLGTTAITQVVPSFGRD